MAPVLGHICDRCNTPWFGPHRNQLCPSCHLAQLTPAQRVKLLGRIDVTGVRA